MANSSTGRKSPKGESPDARTQQPPQSNFQRLWTRFLERKKTAARKEEHRVPVPEQRQPSPPPKEPNKAAPASPSSTQRASSPTKTSHSPLPTRRSRSPQVSPENTSKRRDKTLTPTPHKALRGATPTTTRQRIPPRSLRRTLPSTPDYSYRTVGPFSATYRNRFGIYSRISSSPPLRRRLVPPPSPTRSRTGQSSGRASPVRPSQLRLYTLSCATASSAAKQRPPVRHYSPPRFPSPPSPLPRPKKAAPTFASPTQSWAAKRAVSMPSVASSRSVQREDTSRRKGETPKANTCSVGRQGSLSRRTLPRSPPESPTAARRRVPVRSETFRARGSDKGNAATDVQIKQSPTRSRTFSKGDGRSMQKRTVVRSSSAEGPRSVPTIKVTPPSPLVARRENRTTTRLTEHASKKNSVTLKGTRAPHVTKTVSSKTAPEKPVENSTKNTDAGSVSKPDSVSNGVAKTAELTTTSSTSKKASVTISVLSKSNGNLRRASSSSSLKTTEL